MSENSSSSSSSSSSCSHWTIEFFGPKLLATAASNDQQTNPPKEVTLSTKVISAIDDGVTNNITKSIVGLYFSASWCPPCKTFTFPMSLIRRMGLIRNNKVWKLCSDHDETIIY
jgi:thiol-disulfide isomerase/thioredoxin